MPFYRYWVEHGGGAKTDVINARNMNDAVDALTSQGLKVLEIKRVNLITVGLRALLRSNYEGRITRTEVAMALKRLAVMRKAGVWLGRALEIVYKQEESLPLRSVFLSIVKQVQAGTSFSWAISQHPDVFDPIAVAMIKIGDATGRMDEMLFRLCDFMEREIRREQRLKSAMMYPIFVFVACLLAFGMIFWFVLPPILDAFLGTGRSLPLPTQLLMAIMHAVCSPWVEWSVVFGLVYYFGTLREYLKTPQGKFVRDRLKLKLPLLGTLQKRLVVSNFCRVLGILTVSGVPGVKAVKSAVEFVGNEYFLQLHAPRIVTGVREGETIAHAIIATGFFPPLASNVVAVGERTGNLGSLLMKAADFYDLEVEYAIEQFLVMLEPLMLGAMGVFVGFVLVSVFLPLYQTVMSFN